MTTRTCKRCGATMPGAGPRRRFCSDACRAAGFRSANAPHANAKGNAEAVVEETEAAAVAEEDEAPPQPDPRAVEPGRCRAGLEAWIGTDPDPDLPQALVEAGRALADEVDAAPRNSPLWGRYTAILTALVEARGILGARAEAELQATMRGLQQVDADETERAQRCRGAETSEEARRWTRVVPIGCLEGEHRPYRWPLGAVACLDCGSDPDLDDAEGA